MSEIANKVKAIVSEHLDVKPDEVTEDAKFRELGADSLETVELIMKFEKEFKLNIESDDAEELTTVGKAITYLEQRLA